MVTYQAISFYLPLTALVLAFLSVGVLYIGRKRFEGMPYNVALSSEIGDIALVCAILAAATAHKGRVGSTVYAFDHYSFHLMALAIAVFFGPVVQVALLAYSRKLETLMDVYHNVFVVPLLIYLIMVTLPLVLYIGTQLDIAFYVSMCMLWLALLLLDARAGRLDQRAYLKNIGVNFSWKDAR